MYAGLQYTPLIIFGLAAICWGLPAAHRLRRPWDIAAAFTVLIGVIMIAMGVL